MSEHDRILLRDIAGVTDELAAALAALGFLDATQLLGATDVEGVGLYLADALGMSDAELADVVDAARRVASLPVAEHAQAPLVAFGALPPGPTIAAEIARLQTSAPEPTGALPPAVSLLAQMPPVRSQGARGTCVAFALAAVLEHHRRGLGHRDDLSEQFLYHETKRIDGAPGSCGTWQVKALEVLGTVGVCRERVWAYNAAPPCNQNGVPPAAARADAAQRTCASVVLRPGDIEGARVLLAGGRALALSIPVYGSWVHSAAVRMTGRITLRLASEPVIGGHAMAMVGYQDDPEQPGGGVFIVRNSWGPRWAPASAHGPGYGVIPYAYVARDAWELVTVA